jgi:hypothetical protein
VGRNTTVTVNHFNRGDRWQPRHDRRDYVSDRRVTRNRYYPGRHTANETNRLPTVADSQRRTTRASVPRRTQAREPIAFRERPRTPTIARGDSADRSVRRSNRNEGSTADGTRREPVARVTPRNSDTAARARNEPTRIQRQQPRQRTQVPQVRRVEPKERRSDPTPKLRRAETTAQVRRAEPTAQVRRSENTAQLRRTEPVRQARRAEPTQQATSAPRQQNASKKSAPAAESRQKQERQSQRRR